MHYDSCRQFFSRHGGFQGDVVRAALLLSALGLICGFAALFGMPAVYVMGKPVLGVLGLQRHLSGRPSRLL